MHTADDDSIPVPHDAFRVPRGALKWKAPYRTVLLVLGGAYAVLIATGSLTPGLQAESAREPLHLPLLAQLALGAAGLAALVWVLARAVHEVDKRPYVAIAPVFATFAALVHTGMRVDLSPLGASSALIPFGVLAVALIGGALIVRPDAQAQRLGWGLVIGPWLLLMIALDLAKADAAFTPSERAYTLGLLFSSLVLGAAGLASRTLRNLLMHAETPLRAEAEQVADVPTRKTSAPADEESASLASLGQRLLARAARLPIRTRLVCVTLAAGALSYFGLRSSSNDPAPPALPPRPAQAAVAPVVQQLSVPGAPATSAAKSQNTDAPRTAPAARQTASSMQSSQPASRQGGSAPAPVARKAAPAARPQLRPAPSPLGLPAWDDVDGFKRPGAGPKTREPTGAKTPAPTKPTRK